LAAGLASSTRSGFERASRSSDNRARGCHPSMRGLTNFAPPFFPLSFPTHPPLALHHPPPFLFSSLPLPPSFPSYPLREPKSTPEVVALARTVSVGVRDVFGVTMNPNRAGWLLVICARSRERGVGPFSPWLFWFAWTQRAASSPVTRAPGALRPWRSGFAAPPKCWPSASEGSTTQQSEKAKPPADSQCDVTGPDRQKPRVMPPDPDQLVEVRESVQMMS